MRDTFLINHTRNDDQIAGRIRSTAARPVLLPCLVLLTIFASNAHAEQARDDFSNWPLLQPVFESTGGGGIMIHDYDPKITGQECKTDFRAITPDGTTYDNSVTFDAVETQGGILCTNGRWRSRDGKMEGTTPFQVFIKDGVKRGK